MNLIKSKTSWEFHENDDYYFAENNRNQKIYELTKFLKL